MDVHAIGAYPNTRSNAVLFFLNGEQYLLPYVCGLGAGGDAW
ncbi:hypothetical protein [Aquitalea sp.]|nr:hypothetical protein [Aquitalea sp.]